MRLGGRYWLNGLNIEYSHTFNGFYSLWILPLVLNQTKKSYKVTTTTEIKSKEREREKKSEERQYRKSIGRKVHKQNPNRSSIFHSRGWKQKKTNLKASRICMPKYWMCFFPLYGSMLPERVDLVLEAGGDFMVSVTIWSRHKLSSRWNFLVPNGCYRTLPRNTMANLHYLLCNFFRSCQWRAVPMSGAILLFLLHFHRECISI